VGAEEESDRRSDESRFKVYPDTTFTNKHSIGKGESGLEIQWPQRTRATADRMRILFKVYPDTMFANKHFIRETLSRLWSASLERSS
jgi:hypothetical protein